MIFSSKSTGAPLKHPRSGFTLFELSFVIIIIGLLVGGILIGEHLLASAKLRMQIAQIESFNTSAHTFRVKYNALPGDINNPTVFGMIARDGTNARGDDDSAIEAAEGTQCSETFLFWRDLYFTALISEPFVTAVDYDGTDCHTGTIAVADFLPIAKAGGFVTVYADAGGKNYFELANVPAIAEDTGVATTAANFKNIDAFGLDAKLDDGVPTTGNVTATIAPALNTLATDGTCRASASAYDIATDASQKELECNLRIEAQF